MNVLSAAVSIDGVPYYKITGRYCFRGDLILTRGSIYFFPHTDLELQRDDAAQALEVLGMGGRLLVPIVAWVVRLLRPLAVRGVNNSDLRDSGLWQDGDSSESLQSRLNGRITELKRGKFSRTGLPIPLRVGRDEVTRLRISAGGTLSFDAQSDSHDFSVGMFRKQFLREALWQCGFTLDPQSK